MSRKRKAGAIAPPSDGDAIKPTIHQMDPEGDTLLTLVNPNSPFVTKRLKNDEGSWIAPAESSGTSNTDPIQMRLSSTHLKLASDYFRKMMASNWKESEPKDGFSFSVTADGWSEEALLTVMRILHGRTSMIPRKMNLEMLAKVAVIVDYYQCHEATHFFTKVWIDNLEDSFPDPFGRSLLLRFFISWVFSEVNTFQGLSQIIIQESRGPVDAQELPIPKAIIDALEEKRQDMVSGIISGLDKLKGQLSETENECSFECSSMTLGALLKGMQTMSLLDALPTSPFEGYSFMRLKEVIKTIREPNYANMHKSFGDTRSGLSMLLIYRRCSLKRKLDAIIDEESDKANGLDLNEFMNAE